MRGHAQRSATHLPPPLTSSQLFPLRFVTFNINRLSLYVMPAEKQPSVGSLKSLPSSFTPSSYFPTVGP